MMYVPVWTSESQDIAPDLEASDHSTPYHAEELIILTCLAAVLVSGRNHAT